MGRELVGRRAGALVRRAQDARSTATIGFDGAVLTWSSLPEESRRAARHRGRVLAEQVGTDAAYEQRGHETAEVVRGWRAHRDAVVVVVADRPVVPGPDGMVPFGLWRHVSVHRYDVVGEPKRRLGRVPAGVVTDRSGSAGAQRPVGVPPHGPQEAGAASAWPYLPAPVRDGLVRAVPVASDWLGGIVQRGGGHDQVLSQSITMLRRDDACAVVLVATRERRLTPGLRPGDEEAALATTDWLVDQLTFELRPQPLLEATRAVRRLPWT